jgi:hypothetical protein|tara:strand:+ start:30 stop:1616 length:1587 start_codon:yes stop_codon:yes gene_type:complete
MPSCIRLRPITPLTAWALALLVSACTPTQSTIKPAQPIKATAQPKLQPKPQHLDLTLHKAYQMLQTKTSVAGSNTPTTSSLFHFYQKQDQLEPELSKFFKQQNAALAVTETFWELAIIDAALQRIWLEQKKLIPDSAKHADQNAGTSISHAHLAQLKALASTSAELSSHRQQTNHNLLSMTGSKSNNFSLNYLPLSELRLRLPEANRLLINEFSKHLLKQHTHATYARLSANHANLKSLQVSQLYQQPILGTYVWQEIEKTLNHQVGLLPPHTPNLPLAQELRLTQLNMSLVDYHYSQLKMASIKGQHEVTESLYQLSQEQMLDGNINQQEVNSRSLEAMAMHLLYLQATLDSVRAYARLLASSHLPPNWWQQSVNSLSLADKNDQSILKITDLAPASGTDQAMENSDHLVSVTGYSENTSTLSNNVNHSAVVHYLKRPKQPTMIAAAALKYLWQVDLGEDKSVQEAQALLKEEPDLTYLAHYQTPEAGSNNGVSRLIAVGLGHRQGRALCVRLKALAKECWLQQSEH